MASFFFKNKELSSDEFHFLTHRLRLSRWEISSFKFFASRRNLLVFCLFFAIVKRVIVGVSDHHIQQVRLVGVKRATESSSSSRESKSTKNKRKRDTILLHTILHSLNTFCILFWFHLIRFQHFTFIGMYTHTVLLWQALSKNNKLSSHGKMCETFSYYISSSFLHLDSSYTWLNEWIVFFMPLWPSSAPSNFLLFGFCCFFSVVG